MPAQTTIKVVGVKDAINQLSKIDKELQKQFKADATAIAQPAIKAAKSAYSVLSNEQHPYALSGMARNWTSQGRKIFPFKLDRAIKGVQTKFDTRRRAIGVILIEQKDQAAAIFETAGRKTDNRLDTSLRIAGYPVSAGRTRLIGPAVYKARKGIENEMQKMIVDTIQVVEKAM